MAKKTTTKKSLARKEQGGALAVTDYGDDADRGFENQTGEDIAIPFIAILQDLSPQTKKRKPEYIEGAEPGMLFNTVTGELFEQEVLIVPALTEHCYIEWIPRDEGGGFVARHELDSDIVRDARANQEFGKYTTKAGNDLMETFYVWGAAIIDGEAQFVGIAFSSTKIKVYKKWNTKIGSFTQFVSGRKQRPPLYAHRVILTTVPDQNAKGEFHNFELRPANGDIGSSLLDPAKEDENAMLAAGRAAYDVVTSGRAKPVYESQGTAAGGAEDAEPAF